jgi:uncharacterized membrane protein
VAKQFIQAEAASRLGLIQALGSMDEFSHWQVTALVALALVSSLLILRVVPPNRWFGICTPRTLANEAEWYGANRAAGLVLFSAMAAGVGVHYLARSAGPACGLLNFLVFALLVVAVVRLYRGYAA